jgi:membrane protein CcdC involved in cytochrome C biogenesis
MLKLDIGNLTLGVLCFILAHIGAFYQLNGQFIWKWFEKNEIAVAAFGMVLSFFYIWGTKYTVAAMDGLLWPARFIGFGIGMLLYAIFVNHYFAESINLKTMVSLVLCVALISIQVLWKVN